MSKYCEKCNKEIKSAEANFCPDCGSSLIDVLQNEDNIERSDTQSRENSDNIINGEKLPEKLVFYKSKMIGNVTYKEVQTEIEIKTDTMYIHQGTRKFFVIKRKKEEAFKLSSIRSATLQTKMDFWDTFYGVLFIIAGFYAPLCFLMAAICLYCGYGKVITLEMLNGSKFQIPLKGNMEDAEKLISYCK